MRKPRVGVVGGGVVGTAMQELFGANAVVYDPYRTDATGTKDEINTCDVVLICVPTPPGEDGSCNTSIVEESVAWVEAPLIIIRSTVAPGTTDRLREKYGKRIVFQPEYLGETTAHVFGNVAEREFIVLGGATEDISRAADFYKHAYNAMVRFYFCDALTAELAKYMENAFYAVKVTFVNEFFDVARAHGADFNLLREIWLADPRISRDHTFVYPDARGFSGKCLPKDCAAIVASCAERGYDAKFLKATLAVNDAFLEQNGDPQQTSRPMSRNASEVARDGAAARGKRKATQGTAAG